MILHGMDETPHSADFSVCDLNECCALSAVPEQSDGAVTASCTAALGLAPPPNCGRGALAGYRAPPTDHRMLSTAKPAQGLSSLPCCALLQSATPWKQTLFALQNAVYLL